ncbi:signal transduction histidine kinase [Salsuginibacillus halophilus]|uniref:histidine kinase n=1 Tax=Salsuginibacillus halophilus TaxID=517424 RepID=A0A2P8H8L6_9BACI|nr:HAMP domain-containing sensor histidine kinase [Salsuginibacillus halophilus]PSL42568.1 signal transduction histidine kinase [Salsuginibacillus halophilus]
MKLSAKTAFIVFSAMLLLIITMCYLFYEVSQSFYKNQLQESVEQRLTAHQEVIETDFYVETLQHIIVMEEYESESQFVFFGENLESWESTAGVTTEEAAAYKQWIEAQEGGTSAFSRTSHHTIPHIYAYEPLIVNDETVGYLFIDEATPEFEETSQFLFWIMLAMFGGSTVLAGFFAWFMKHYVGKPLHRLKRTTDLVADGDFDVQLNASSRDEIGELSWSIGTMAAQLRAYRDSRRSFLSNVSHDLRTPLTYVKAYSSLISEMPEDAAAHAVVIHHEAVRMERLVEDLFQLTKLDEGHFTFSFEQVEAGSLVSETVETIRSYAHQHEVTMTLNSPDEKLELSADPARLQQALLNVLSNAIHHTDSAVHVSLRHAGDEVEICIEDEGPGLTADEAELVWARFYRTDAARSTKDGGSGLGLAIAKEFIEAHGGHVHSESPAGRGARFHLYLPLLKT